MDDLRNFSNKWTRINNGTEVKGLDRGKIRFDQTTAATLDKIRTFLDAHTAEGDYVYFFPNEAAYYFLFNRTNPTRFAMAYFAVTSDHRRELVADLEKKKPLYIIYSLKTWRIDDIPEYQQVPEIVSYLRQNYKKMRDMGEFLILQKIPVVESLEPEQTNKLN